MKKIRIKTERVEVEAHDVPPLISLAALLAVVLVVVVLVVGGFWVA